MIIRIYKIVNTVDSQVYVGSTKKTLRERFDKHKTDYRKEKNNSKIYLLMREYGIEKFKIELIEEVKIDEDEDEKKRYKIEGEWVKKLKAELNTYHPEGQKCEHNKQRYQCKDCGGSQICEHNKQRSYCKECGGSSICDHNRQRHQCKDCGGSQICEHNKIRSSCKECGGGSICEHNKIRSQCKDCGGSQICEHNIQRRRHCVDCCGISCRVCKTTTSIGNWKQHLKTKTHLKNINSS